MPHLHDEDKDKADTDDESVCPVAESAANKLLSLAAMAEEHGKSNVEVIQKEETEPPQLVDGHPSSPTATSASHPSLRPPPFLEDSRHLPPPPSPGMGPRWGQVVSHHPHFHGPGFVRPGVMHPMYPGPMGGPAGGGSPVAMVEHPPPVRYMHRGGRGGFPMWTASPRPPYRPPVHGGASPLPPSFRSHVTPPGSMARKCSNDDESSVSSGRAPKRASLGYPPKSILKKPRVETPPTASSSETSSPPSEVDATKDASTGPSNYTLSKTVSASTDAGMDNADEQSKTTIESVVVEKSSFSSEDMSVKRQRIISPASSNEYPKGDHDEDYGYSQDGSLSPEQRSRLMSHEAAAAAGSPGPHYRLIPPFRMGRPPPPVQGMHCGPRRPGGPYMPPGPMYPHPHGMRPFPPLAMPAVAGPGSMYPPRNTSSRGRPGFAAMPPFYVRPRMEASPSPSLPDQSRTKHVLEKPSQSPVAASPVASAIPRRQSGKSASVVVGLEALGDASGSANRCIPLTPPVPSKYWSEADTTKDIILPDFHRLVNFPDLLVKGRNVAGDGCSDSGSPSALSGKKRCVMCGQLRVSATYVRAKKSSADESSEGSGTASGVSSGNGSSHIIPRQNKGVCTACDVTVWVALELDGLEIKWCKGCKNFRPWSHFGDKSLATKCLRCRERQKEKYAMQKSASRRRSSTSSVEPEEKKTDDHDACSLAVAVAANGLRDLMNAAR